MKRILYFIISILSLAGAFALAVHVFGIKALFMKNVGSFMVFAGHYKEAAICSILAIIAIVFAQLGKKEIN